MVAISKAGYIQWNQDECLGCSRCFTACAVYHHGATSPSLSAIIWHDEQQLDGFQPRKPLFCQQCDTRECYEACPLQDEAICIDSASGAIYIDVNNCNGCGACVDACPKVEPRINLADIDGRTVAVKCDLCKGREKGPVCIEICSRQALTLAQKDDKS